MKIAIKAIIVLALFCGTAFADGDMGNGGFWAGDGTTTTTTTTSEEDGDTGNGGKTCPEGQTCLTEDPADPYSILDLVKDLLSAAL